MDDMNDGILLGALCSPLFLENLSMIVCEESRARQHLPSKKVLLGRCCLLLPVPLLLIVVRSRGAEVLA
jgi:hypothetical protein